VQHHGNSGNRNERILAGDTATVYRADITGKCKASDEYSSKAMCFFGEQTCHWVGGSEDSITI